MKNILPEENKKIVLYIINLDKSTLTITYLFYICIREEKILYITLIENIRFLTTIEKITVIDIFICTLFQKFFYTIFNNSKMDLYLITLKFTFYI